MAINTDVALKEPLLDVEDVDEDEGLEPVVPQMAAQVLAQRNELQ